MGKTPKLTIQQQAARASWVAPLATFGLMLICQHEIRDAKSPLTGLIVGALTLLLLASGVVAGIVGCFGVKRSGARTTLVPGLIGAALSAIILGLLIAIAVPSFGRAREASLRRRIDALQKMADQANRQLPAMTDSETRVDRIKVLGPYLLEYQYTCVNADQGDPHIDELLSEARPKIVEYYRTSDDFKLLRQQRISVQYSFFDRSGEPITKIVVSAKDALGE